MLVVMRVQLGLGDGCSSFPHVEQGDIDAHAPVGRVRPSPVPSEVRSRRPVERPSGASWKFDSTLRAAIQITAAVPLARQSRFGILRLLRVR